MQKVLVRWYDSFSVLYGWQKPKHMDQEPLIVETVGWLIKGALKGHVVVALNHVQYDNVVDSGIAIPKENVIKITKLKKK